MTDAVAALVALTVMEIVLGIDNIVFIAIVASQLPADKQPRACLLLGLAVALLLRLALLFTCGCANPGSLKLPPIAEAPQN